MNDTSTAHEARQELQLRAARALIARQLGSERLASLHASNPVIDVAAIVGLIALFLLLMGALAIGSVRSPLWWLCLIVQGNLVVTMGILNHDVFVHRKLLPPRIRWVASSILAWPAQLRSAVYESQHLVHHRSLGTNDDTEVYKQAIDTWWKRIAYATPALPVYRVIFHRALVSRRELRVAHGGATRLRWERNTRRTITALALASLFWDWRLLVFGYLLPFVMVTPMINTVRIVLEHFDLERSNPLWVGTCYRTGIVTRLMFWWGAGDCHLIHHYYANIPFYRMGAAVRLMRPILQQEGVYEHRSLPCLLWDWFTAARGHWSVPAGAPPKKARPV